jgi:hypothetical protein
MSFTTSATNISASGKTGGLCSRSGPYKSASAVVVFFRQGQKFTADPVNGKATTWSMVGTFDRYASAETV